MDRNQRKGITRRTMMATCAGALAPLVLPSGIVSALGRAGANSRAQVALIGCGRRGIEILEQLGGRVAAICDVDARRLDAASAIAPNARRHQDYRQVLEDRNLDGVVIATPDHWHAIQACEAMEAGKDVYLETPVCLTLGDAARLVSTARQFGSVVHTGKATLWSRGKPELLELGPNALPSSKTRVSCWGEDNLRGGTVTENGPAPEALDWERWIGPARWRPFNPALLDGNARFVLGLGGGELASQGSHVFYAALDALQLKSLGTVRVDMRGTPLMDCLYDAPQAVRVEYELLDQNVELVWQQRKFAMGGLPFGARVTRDGMVTALDPVFADTPDIPSPPRRVLAESLRYWLDSIVLRPDTVPELERAASAAALAAMGNVAYRVGRPVTWDSAAGTFLNDAVANRLIAPPKRPV